MGFAQELPYKDISEAPGCREVTARIRIELRQPAA